MPGGGMDMPGGGPMPVGGMPPGGKPGGGRRPAGGITGGCPPPPPTPGRLNLCIIAMLAAIFCSIMSSVSCCSN
jgi:hypothetical protein